MVRCGCCLKENRDGATTCQRCASQLGTLAKAAGPGGDRAAHESTGGQNRGTRPHAQRLSAVAPSQSRAGADTGAPAPNGTPDVAPDVAEPKAARGPGAAVNVRGRMVSVLPNGRDETVYWLEDEQTDIGRTQEIGPTQELGRQRGGIRIDDPQLAPLHARLNMTLGGALLTPLDRRNGVYLRLRAVAELADGDHVLLGRQVLRFEVVPEHERRPRPGIEDGVVLFGTPSPPAWGRLRQLTASGLGRDLYHLSRAEMTLGREQADLVFADDEFLSRRHAQLTILRGKPVLQDLGSSNGTYLRLRTPQVLVPGDMIRLGDQLLRFELG